MDFVVFELHLKQQFEIGLPKSYRFVLKMTKNVKLRMYKKWGFFLLADVSGYYKRKEKAKKNSEVASVSGVTGS